MKATFLEYDKPLLTAMIHYSTPEECIVKIKASIEDGADAIGVCLCRLKKEYRTKEILTEIFEACEGKPIYVTSYRYYESEGISDYECAELLLLALDCGATLCDVMGDMFERSPRYELAESEEAIAKQKSLIDEIHRRGGEVLMSSHVYRSISLEENLMIARTHIDRGADIIKIVNLSEDISELPSYVDVIYKIQQMTEKKLLFLASGPCEILRYIGPSLGVCMYLCVQHHGTQDTTAQPTLKKLKAIRDNIIF